MLSKRDGKVYIDYVQNGYGCLFVVFYCVCLLLGVFVLVLLCWSEVNGKLSFGDYMIQMMLVCVKCQKSDLFLLVFDEILDLLGVLMKFSEFVQECFLEIFMNLIFEDICWIEDFIVLDSSLVGIDVKRIYVLILYMLEMMEKWLIVFEQKFDVCD